MKASDKGPSANAWGVRLTSPVTVQHDGKLVTLACVADKPTDTLYYRVLDQKDPNAGPDSEDWNGWYRFQFPEARQPSPPRNDHVQHEHRLSGMGLLTVTPAAHKAMPAKASFTVTSDDRFLYVFRSSACETLYLDRMKLIAQSVDQRSNQTTRYRLERAWEIRYQRSGRRDTPYDDNDTQSFVDMRGNPFYEPTLEFSHIDRISPGNFSVARVPTADATRIIWYVAVNEGEGIRLHRFEQTGETLADYSEPAQTRPLITPVLADGKNEEYSLQLLPECAPALAFHAEQDETRAQGGRRVELQKAGRLMLVFGVKSDEIEWYDGKAFDHAAAVLDFGLDTRGRIPYLGDDLQELVIADGEIVNQKFEPDTGSPSYPPPNKAARSTRVIDGLTVTAMALGQARTHADPTLNSGEDGLVHLYYSGDPLQNPPRWSGLVPGSPEGMVAQYDPRVSRLAIAAPWEYAEPGGHPPGNVYFVSRQSGPGMTGASIHIGDVSFDGQPQTDLCEVVITYPEAMGLKNEAWLGVPRDIRLLLRTLNGGASDEASDPDVADGTTPFFDFRGQLPVVRVPLTHIGDETEAPDAGMPRLTLISGRPDIPLSCARISFDDATGKPRLVLRLKSDGTDELELVYANLPDEVDAWPDLFSGNGHNYDYGAVDESTPLFALHTESTNVRNPLIMYPAKPGSDLSKMTIMINNEEDEDRERKITITFNPGSSDEISIPRLPAKVDAFVECLKGSEIFRELGLEISDAGVCGHVKATSEPRGRIDLRESTLLLELILPSVSTAGMTAKPDLYSAGRFRRRLEGDGRRDKRRITGFMVTADEPDTGAGAVVKNKDAQSASTTANRRIPDRANPDIPQGGAWIRETPHHACAFNGSNEMTVPITRNGNGVRAESRALRPQTRWTLEAWVKPRSSRLQRLVSFRDAETKLPDHMPSLEYCIGLKAQQVLQFKSCADGSPSYLQTGAVKKPGFLAPGAFTWEFWIQPEDTPAPEPSTAYAKPLPPLGGIVQINDAGHIPLFSIGLDHKRRIVIRTNGGEPDDEDCDHCSDARLPHDDDGDAVWTHIAITCIRENIGEDGNDKETCCTLCVYLDGRYDCTFEAKLPSVDSTSLIIGRNVEDEFSVFGRIVLLRYWDICKTEQELRRDAFAIPHGAAPGLLGCWPLTSIDNESTFPNIAERTRNPLWNARRECFDQVAKLADDGAFLSIIASVGGCQPAEAPAMLANRRWNHLALVYEAEGGIDVRNGAWARSESSEALNVATAFAIDAWVIVKSCRQGAILSKWSWDEDPDNQSYRLEIDMFRRLVFTIKVIENEEGDIRTIQAISTERLPLDQALHIAVKFVGKAGETDTPEDDCSKANYEVRLHIDNREVGRAEGMLDTSRITIQSSKAYAYVGRSVSIPEEAENTAGGDLLQFSGIIGRLRFWEGDVREKDLFPEHHRHMPRFNSPEGLVSEWNFNEGEDLVAEDRAGNNNLVLSSSSLWTQLRETSSLRFYANGMPIVGVELFDGHLPVPSSSKFVIGGKPDDEDDSGYTGFEGSLARLTLWEKALSRTHIRATMRTPRNGDEDALLAGWDFRYGGIDITGGGNNADPPLDTGRCSPSSVPVTSEGAIVRNAYGGRVTDYGASTTGRIAVAAHVEVRDTSTQRQQATLMRHLELDANAAPIPGIDVGTMDLVYIGQQQTEPKLIGFIEGAPPVPSENLTRPVYMAPSPVPPYLDTTTVKLITGAARHISYSGSFRHTGHLHISSLAGVVHDAKTSMGAFLTTEVLDFESEMGYRLGTNFSFRDTRDRGYDATWSSRQIDKLGVAGDWEPADSLLNEEVGRRFEVQNLGMAVVESITADQYALVYHATGASIGTIVIPNLGIPPDRNLLMFPMNDADTKAGTLDGKIGFVNDPIYGSAPDFKRKSYFKPEEAYALAARIEQQHLRNQAYAEEFKDEFHLAPRHYKLGSAAKMKDVPNHLPVAFEEDPEEKRLVPVPKSGIVNRYTWTAGGGLHVESQSYAATASRAYQGNFGLFTELAGFTKGKLTLSGQGLSWGLDVGGGYNLDIQVGTDTTTEGAVSLEVDVKGEDYLRAWRISDDGSGGEFLPGDAPGKVNAYRFMSFYLPPDSRNSRSFRSIVDPVWLQRSKDNAAKALRQLDTSNPSWRVLHRVTYVERVPPPVADRPVFTTRNIRRVPVNLEDNAELLRLIDKQLDKNKPLTPVAVGTAVATVLNPPPGADGEYPKSILENIVPWWACFLETARPGDDQETEAAELLHELMLAVADYCIDGYLAGVLPIDEPDL